MNEKNTQSAPESQQPKAGVPDSVAADLSALAAEVTRMRKAASRGWKITAAVFIVLLAVIATYLSILVGMLRDYANDPATIVELVVPMVDEALKSAVPDMPGLSQASQWPEWGARKAIEAAPMLMQDRLKPELQRQLDMLPQHRVTWAARVRAEMPARLDAAMVDFKEKHLPWLRTWLVHRATLYVDSLLSQADEQLTLMVQEVLAREGNNLKVVTDQEQLRAALEVAFEEAMGSYLDEIFVELDKHINSAATRLGELVTGQATDQKAKLELRILQITRELFSRVEMPGEGRAVPGAAGGPIPAGVGAGGPMPTGPRGATADEAVGPSAEERRAFEEERRAEEERERAAGGARSTP